MASMSHTVRPVPDKIWKLLQTALSNAHAPYSHFPVASVLLASNKQGKKKWFSGCNVENISYGLTICAERTAIGAAVSQGYHKLHQVYIYVKKEPYGSPCGACRQVIYEFGPKCDVFLVADGKKPMQKFQCQELLPYAFNSQSLLD